MAPHPRRPRSSFEDLGNSPRSSKICTNVFVGLESGLAPGKAFLRRGPGFGLTVGFAVYTGHASRTNLSDGTMTWVMNARMSMLRTKASSTNIHDWSWRCSPNPSQPLHNLACDILNGIYLPKSARSVTAKEKIAVVACTPANVIRPKHHETIPAKMTPLTGVPVYLFML